MSGTKPAEPGKRSLHLRILDDLEGNILSGRWPPGHRIPFEHELTEAYGCSRMTVNKALTELVRRGLIERRRKSGSFVSRPQSQSAVMEIRDIKAEVQSLGALYRYRRISRAERAAGPAERKRFDLAAGARWVDVVAVHLAGPRPFCLEERLISIDAVPEARDEGFEQGAPGPWLIAHLPWSAAEHRISAVAADARVATLLGIEPNAACLVIERRTWSGGATVTHVRLTYPAGSHELVAEFAPSQHR